MAAWLLGAAPAQALPGPEIGPPLVIADPAGSLTPRMAVARAASGAGVVVWGSGDRIRRQGFDAGLAAIGGVETVLSGDGQGFPLGEQPLRLAMADDGSHLLLSGSEDGPRVRRYALDGSLLPFTSEPELGPPLGTRLDEGALASCQDAARRERVEGDIAMTPAGDGALAYLEREVCNSFGGTLVLAMRIGYRSLPRSGPLPDPVLIAEVSGQFNSEGNRDLRVPELSRVALALRTDGAAAVFWHQGPFSREPQPGQFEFVEGQVQMRALEAGQPSGAVQVLSGDARGLPVIEAVDVGDGYAVAGYRETFDAQLGQRRSRSFALRLSGDLSPIGTDEGFTGTALLGLTRGPGSGHTLSATNNQGFGNPENTTNSWRGSRYDAAGTVVGVFASSPPNRFNTSPATAIDRRLIQGDYLAAYRVRAADGQPSGELALQRYGGPEGTQALNIVVMPETVTVNDGQRPRVSWRSNVSQDCFGTGNLAGRYAPTGQLTVGPFTVAGDRQYGLSCGAGAALNQTAVLRVVGENTEPAPTVDLTVSPQRIVFGEQATLSWTSSNAQFGCTASGDWIGSRASSGSETFGVVAPGEYRYTLTCEGRGGSASDTVLLTVSDPQAMASVSVSVDPAQVLVNEPFTLRWTSENIENCDLLINDTPQFNGVGASGEVTDEFDLAGTYTFKLDCTGPNGPASGTATVEVIEPTPVVRISVNPTQVQVNEPFTLSWASANTSSCDLFLNDVLIVDDGP
ncbi:MAG TPA: hypothetical protein VFV27_10670, partial [Nevskiaceae bacterium]|nr:hypothetical protein [Nevskiaceae bacterium]